MVGNVEFVVVNRHSFVRAAPHECLRQPRGTKMIRFPPSPRDQGLVLIWWHFKTMPDYGAKVGTLIHTFIFSKTAGYLPAVLFSRFLAWLGVRG